MGAFGFGNIFNTIKEAAKTLQEAKNLELYQRMMAVYGNVMDLVEKNRELSDENRSLKEKLAIKEALTFDGKAYWLEKDGKKEGPFCSTCWDVIPSSCESRIPTKLN
jgi:regulator of replication initiation timing